MPSLEKMAKEKQVSVSTIRRMLNSIGVTKSVNGHATASCDLQPAVRRRLSDYAQSLQILFLSCREVSKITVESLDQEARLQFIKRLTLLRRLQRYELAVYGILELITHFAPLQAIRIVYGGLFRQLLWGYPLRSIKGRQRRIKKICLASPPSFSAVSAVPIGRNFPPNWKNCSNLNWPLPQNSSPPWESGHSIHLFNTSSSLFISMGFAIWSFIPLLRAFATSAVNASAVNAMIGTVPASHRFSDRMAVVAS